MPTPEEIRTNLLAWVEDLETTTEPQTTGRLYRPSPDHRPVGYCCLGRAAVVLDLRLCDEGLAACTTDGSNISICTFMDSYGLTKQERNLCVEMNDGQGKTFPEIAAWLREYVLPRYSPSVVQEEQT